MQVQANSNDVFNMNLSYTGAQGIGTQRLESGFNVYPGDLDYDYFWWHFEIDMPTDFLVTGEVVYQWAQFRDVNDEDAGVFSVGCKTEVGDTDAVKIELFAGDNSMENDSLFVAGRSWKDQNEESNFNGHAYTRIENDSMYELLPSKISNLNSVQSCYAQINIDNKVARAEAKSNGQSIFNRYYEVTLGARLYASDQDSSFIGLPENDFTLKFGEPQYVPPEEEVTEEEIVEQKLNTP